MYGRHRGYRDIHPCPACPTDRHPPLLFADSAPALCLLSWLWKSISPLYPHTSLAPNPRPSFQIFHVFNPISRTHKTNLHFFSSFLLPPGVPDAHSLFFTPSLKSLPSHAHSPHSSSVLPPDKTLSKFVPVPPGWRPSL